MKYEQKKGDQFSSKVYSLSNWNNGAPLTKMGKLWEASVLEKEPRFAHVKHEVSIRELCGRSCWQLVLWWKLQGRDLGST